MSEQHLSERIEQEALFDDSLVLPRSISELWTEDEESWRETNDIVIISNNRYNFENNVILRESTGLRLNWQASQKRGEPTLDYGITPAESIEIASEHYAKLRAFGMCVVSHSHEVRTDVDGEEFYLYSPILNAERIVEESELLTFSLMRQVPKDKINAFAAQPAADYLNWCESTQQAFYLPQVFRLGNYAVQQSSGILYFQEATASIWPYQADNYSAQHQIANNNLEHTFGITVQ